MQKRTLKGLACTALGVLSLSALDANAVNPGFYFGLMTGPATNGAGEIQAQVQGMPSTTPITSKSSQFGTRLYLGNKFNNYAAFEFGLNFFTGIKFDTKGVETCDSPQIRVRDIDLLGKFDFTIAGFSAFVKAGPALVYVNESGSLDPDLSSSCGDSKNSTNLKPLIGIGLSYDLTQNWVVDLSANRLMVGGKAKSVDHYALGISYHFVDVYCGQFLCE